MKSVGEGNFAGEEKCLVHAPQNMVTVPMDGEETDCHRVRFVSIRLPLGTQGSVDRLVADLFSTLTYPDFHPRECSTSIVNSLPSHSMSTALIQVSYLVRIAKPLQYDVNPCYKIQGSCIRYTRKGMVYPWLPPSLSDLFHLTSDGVRHVPCATYTPADEVAANVPNHSGRSDLQVTRASA